MTIAARANVNSFALRGLPDRVSSCHLYSRSLQRGNAPGGRGHLESQVDVLRREEERGVARRQVLRLLGERGLLAEEAKQLEPLCGVGHRGVEQRQERDRA